MNALKEGGGPFVGLGGTISTLHALSGHVRPVVVCSRRDLSPSKKKEEIFPLSLPIWHPSMSYSAQCGKGQRRSYKLTKTPQGGWAELLNHLKFEQSQIF